VVACDTSGTPFGDVDGSHVSAVQWAVHAGEGGVCLYGRCNAFFTGEKVDNYGTCVFSANHFSITIHVQKISGLVLLLDYFKAVAV
jgi:hypothetical protein